MLHGLSDWKNIPALATLRILCFLTVYVYQTSFDFAHTHYSDISPRKAVDSLVDSLEGER